MKAFMVVFALSWIFGVLLGAIEFARPAGLLAISSAAGWWLAARLFVLPRQYALCAASLGLLGVLWGHSSHTLLPVCPDSELSGVVTEIYSLEESRAQYVFTSEEGCTVLVTTSRFPEYRRGAKVKLTGDIQLVSEIPEEYAGYAKYLARRGIAATARYPAIDPTTQEASGEHDTKTALISRIQTIFLEPESSVVAAMLLGERGGIPDSTKDRLRIAGVSHILAISGLHVSLLLGLVLIAAYLLPVPPGVRTTGVLVLLWAYVSLLNFPPSATRAALFWTAALLALRARALVSLPAVITGAAVVMVSASPAILYDAGFQLSMAAVAGIGLALFLTKVWRLSGWKRWIGNLFLVSLGATLATWPITVAQFGSVSLIGAAANLLVVPVMPLLLAAAVVALLLSYVFMPAAIAVGMAVRVLWQWIDTVTSAFSSLPLAALEEAGIAWWVTPLYYAGVLVAAAYVLRSQGRTWLEVFE